jgi:hypothetical protein
MSNQTLQGLQESTPREIEVLADQRRLVEGELANLVAFVVKGDVASPRQRDEIHVREERLAELDQQLQRLGTAVAPAPAEIDRAWVEERLRRLHELLGRDPAGARREIQKHIEDLRMAPAPEVGERVIRVTGRAKADGLLNAEEAVHLQLVAGARYHLPENKPLEFSFEVRI